MSHTSDLQSFNKLFNEYQGRFTRFAFFYVKDMATAEDFTIEAFMYYWERREMLTSDSNIPAYILTIIKHKCLNHLRRQNLQTEINENLREHALWELNTRIITLEECDPYELFSKEVQAIIKKTLQTLPEQTRNIFILSRYKNKSHKEIALSLNITTKGVEYHISKALKKLQILDLAKNKIKHLEGLDNNLQLQ